LRFMAVLLNKVGMAEMADAGLGRCSARNLTGADCFGQAAAAM